MSQKIVMSPVDFSKGLLSRLNQMKIKLNFQTTGEKEAAEAVFDVFNKKVSSITGNEAKSPRYRELLRIKNSLAPGIMSEFGAFRHAVFQASQELKKSNEPVLDNFDKEDLQLIEACAQAYIQKLKTSE